MEYIFVELKTLLFQILVWNYQTSMYTGAPAWSWMSYMYVLIPITLLLAMPILKKGNDLKTCVCWLQPPCTLRTLQVSH